MVGMQVFKVGGNDHVFSSIFVVGFVSSSVCILGNYDRKMNEQE